MIPAQSAGVAGRTRVSVVCGAGLAMSAFATASLAQGAGDYPNRPVTVVVAFAAGGPAEFESRLYTQKMSQNLGKPFLLDFRPGNSGITGTTFVAKSAPDGYTLCPGQGSFTVSAATIKNITYDPVKDFAPIILMSKRSMLLVTNPDMPFKSGRDYIAHVKARPGQLNFATLGSGSVFHLAGAWLHGLTGTSVTFVPYKGVTPSAMDLIGGRVQATLMTPEIGLPMVKSGKLRVLATTGTERHPMLQDVPTLIEEGVAGYEYLGWTGFFAPAGTPPAIVNKLNAEFTKAGKSPDVAQKMAESGGAVMVLSTPDFLGKFIANEVGRWKRVVQENNIVVD
jgi:tripartite-type tricarboxylate transporter receptor subunit TctC